MTAATVAFLMTDIEGSTKRWERDAAAMARALERHDAILRQAIEGAGGRVYKTVGDAFCAVFQSPLAAVSAARTAQRAVAGEDWAAMLPDFPPLAVRMAIHAAVVDDAGGDFVGPQGARAQQLLAAGHGGQVLLSAAAAELVRDDLPAALGLRDLGEHRLPDLSRPQRVFQLSAPGLERAFPPLRTLDQRPNNLPQQPASFVGRQADLAELAGLVAPGKLVTLTGVGGTGKTRLALRLAADAAVDYPGGTWLVSLAPIVAPEHVADAAASAMGLRHDGGGTAEAALIDYLRGRQVLLVVDNCEHLLEAAARLIHAILQRCPGVAVVATSRQSLGLVGERVWHVASLSLPEAADPDPAGALRRSEAGQLFLDRAAAAVPGLVVEPAEAVAIAEICRRLDGIPLALELAAARVRVLSPAQIARRLDDRFRLLAGGARSDLAHHQTLRAAMDWSHDLLPPAEQVVFRRAAAFRGGWDLEAAEAVLAGGDLDAWEVLDALGQLIDHSLVEVDAGSGPSARYRLLETVRAYAAEQLEAAGERSEVAEHHARHYAALASAAEGELLGPDQAAWLDRLEREHDNLRAALDWAHSSGDAAFGLGFAASLWRFWYQRGHLEDGRQRLLAALAMPGARAATALRAAALHGAGTLASFQGDLAAARADLEEALAIRQALGDEVGRARTLNNLALVASEQGDYLRARALQEESLAVWRAQGDRPLMAILINNLALMAIVRGDLVRAESLLAESLPLMRQLGNQAGEADALFHLGVLAQLRGRAGEAIARYEACQGLREALDDRQGQSAVLRNRAELAIDEGDLEVAGELLRRCLALDTELADARGASEARQNLGLRAYLMGSEDEAAGWLEGALADQVAIGHKRGQSDSLDALGRLACRRGDLAAAAAHLADSLSLRREMGHWLGQVASLESCAMLAAARGDAHGARRWLGLAGSERARAGAPLPPARRRELDAALARLPPPSAPPPGAPVDLEAAVDAALAWLAA